MLAEARAALDWWSAFRPRRPTSSLTGGGAIEVLEETMGYLLGGRPALALPNATFAMLVALQAAGVRVGDEVLVSGVDWPAARSAGQLLGARIVPLPVDTRDFTVDPGAVASVASPAVRAAILSHLHGLVADVHRIRRALPRGTTIIEDCAQALGATRNGQLAGTSGDYAVFSLGPKKAASAGEMGLLTASTRARYQEAVAVSQHPIRQMLTGIAQPRTDVLIGRPAPLTAVLAAYKLHRWPDAAAQLTAIDRTVRRVVANAGATLLGNRLQHPQPGCLPLLVGSYETELAIRDTLRASFDYAAEVSVSPSGALVDPGLNAPERARLTDALRRVRLVGIRLPQPKPNAGAVAPPRRGAPGSDQS